MNNLLSYKNYNGTVEYSEADDCFFGKVTGIRSLISYEGSSLEELKEDFENAVEEYLDLCSEKNIIPEMSCDKPFKEYTELRFCEAYINF